MSNPAHWMAAWLADHIAPEWAAIGGVIGMGVGMTLIVLAGMAAAHWMESRHERTSD